MKTGGPFYFFLYFCIMLDRKVWDFKSLFGTDALNTKTSFSTLSYGKQSLEARCFYSGLFFVFSFLHRVTPLLRD